MIEKALFIALAAIALFFAAGAVGDALDMMNQKTSCALEGAQVCVIDGKVGQ